MRKIMYMIIYVRDFNFNTYNWVSHRGRIQEERMKLVKEIKKQLIHDPFQKLELKQTSNSFKHKHRMTKNFNSLAEY